MTTPSPNIDKYESRRIRSAIRAVLLAVWDPIGVQDEPNAQDEYDVYLGDVYELLISTATDAEIKKYLDWVATERMGFSDTPTPIIVATIKALRAIPLRLSQD